MLAPSYWRTANPVVLVLPGSQPLQPWVTPEFFEAGQPSAKFVDEPDLEIARMDIPRVEGRLRVIDFRYLVGTPEGIEEFTERSPSSPMRNTWTHSAMRTWRLNTTMKEKESLVVWYRPQTEEALETSRRASVAGSLSR